MKIALGQINPTIGDCAGNTRKIEEAMGRAAAGGAELVLFPELSITGYPPQDLLDSPELALRSLQCVEALAASSKSIAAVVGFVEPNPLPTGKPFYNSAALLRQGKVEAVYRKRLLPYYDVFDDERYFEAGTQAVVFDLKGQRFSITICEDIWNFPGFVPRLYALQPLDAVREAKANWILNLSASPFHLGKPEIREKLFGKVTQASQAGVIFCNQVGANDDLVFDGGSGVWNARGELQGRAVFFDEELYFADLKKPVNSEPFPVTSEAWLASALALGVKDYCRKTHCAEVCLGLSGGIDSSVVAAIAVQALGAEKVKGILLPTQFTSAASNEDAREVAEALGILTQTISVESVFQETSKAIYASGHAKLASLTLENIQPRLRMALLMAIANDENRLLLNTSNKSELAAGYSTLYGDAAGALGVLGDLTKEQVYALARHFNESRPTIPTRVMERAPSAELRENQKDEDSLPPYSVLDPLVSEAVEKHSGSAALVEQGWPAEQVQLFSKLYRQSEYKRRQFPPILRVSSHAFGRGRRIPVASLKPW